MVADSPRSNPDLQYHHHQITLEKIVLLFTLLCVIISFIVGDVLGENSIGGARPDFYDFHWKAIQTFSAKPWREAILGYSSATNPLLYMLTSLLPIGGNPKIYHVVTFVVGFLTWPILSWAYYRRYAKYGIDLLWASFGASAILLSPAFRSSAVWGTTDYLPILFCAVTSLILSRIWDTDVGQNKNIGGPTLVAASTVSASAFYIRQYYAFLPIFALWTVLTRTKTALVPVLIVFALVMIPEVYLLYIWKGFNPPGFQRHFHPAIVDILVVGANVGLLSTPLIVGCIQRSWTDVLPGWWGAYSTVVALAGLVVFMIAFATTEWPGPGEGGGIVVKAGLRIGTIGTFFILVISYLGLVAVIVFSIRSTTNAVLAGTFLGPLLMTFPTYQHYLEPSLTVALFLFADTHTAEALFNKRVLTYNFVFTIAILTVGIGYYHFTPAAG